MPELVLHGASNSSEQSWSSAGEKPDWEQLKLTWPEEQKYFNTLQLSTNESAVM